MLQIYRLSYNLCWLVEFFFTKYTDDSHLKITHWLHSKIFQSTKKSKGTEYKIREYHQKIPPWSFRFHYLLAKPFVIRNGARNWPALNKWNMAFFKDNYPDVKVPFLDETQTKDSSYRELALKDAIESFKTGKKKYCKFSNLLYLLPELQKDLHYQQLDRYKPVISQEGTLQFFLGPGGIQTRLHCALGHNFFTQIYGKKIWRIYPKKYTQLFFPSLCRTPHYISHKNFELPHLHEDIEGQLDHWKVELNPGDILYNPSYLWHSVETPEESIAVKSSWASLNSIFYNPVQAIMTLNVLGLNLLKIRKDFSAGKFFPKKWF